MLKLFLMEELHYGHYMSYTPRHRLVEIRPVGNFTASISNYKVTEICCSVAKSKRCAYSKIGNERRLLMAI